MPHHFRLPARMKSEEELASTFQKSGTLKKLEAKSNFISKQFSELFSSYTQSFNKVYRRRGSLFVKNFKRKEINDEHYLRACILYVHLNPVHHSFAESASEWKWLTHQTFPIDHPRMLELLFDNEANYHFDLQSRQFQNNNFQYDHPLTYQYCVDIAISTLLNRFLPKYLRFTL